MPIRNLLPFADFPAPPAHYVLWEDFDDDYALTSSVPVTGTSPYIGTALASGTVSFATDEQYGVVVLSGAGTSDNSGAQLQRDMEIAALLTGKRTRWMCRAKLSDATESHFFNGLSISDTTICDGADGIAGLTPTDCVGFYKADGGATVALVAKRDSVVVCNSTLPVTLEANTYYWFAFEVDMSGTAGVGNLSGYVYSTAGVLLGRTGPITSTALPYSAEEILTPSLALVSGTATGTISATIDCYGLEMER